MKILADNILCLKIFEDENCLIARNLYANYVQQCYLIFKNVPVEERKNTERQKLQLINIDI